MELMRRISTALVEGKVSDVERLSQEALAAGRSAKAILDQGLIPGMSHVGVQFKKGDMFIPEVLLSARAMQASLSIIRPCFTATEAAKMGKVVIGTVQGDLHNIGKNLVGVMLDGAGFEVHDLGIDVPPDAFVDAVKKEKPDIVAMSALLTTTMEMMRHTIKVLTEARSRDAVKIMVGGAPVTADFAREIGADGYAANAVEAAELARQLIEV